MTKSSPLFSIITAVFNGASHLEDALDSVARQSFRDREHIVVDGGSTDGSVEIIRRRADSLSHWVSEADRGIADAFNKGVRAASGRILLFLGADDMLHDDRVLESVAAGLPSLKQPYFFYGDANYIYQDRIRRIRQNYSLEKFRRYGCIPHQAMFLDREFFDRYGLFDVEYRRAMDYEHTARFIRDREPEYLDRLVADMRRYGVSSSPLPAHAEMDRARLKHGLATRAEVVRDHLILRAKLAVQKTLRLDW